jgi:hypothetical protein
LEGRRRPRTGTRSRRYALAILAAAVVGALAWWLRPPGVDVERPPAAGEVGRSEGETLSLRGVPGGAATAERIAESSAVRPAPRGVFGRVFAADDGAPVAGAWIVPAGRDALVSATDVVRSDAEGRFELPHDVGSRPASLRVVANGFVPITVPTSPDGETVARLSQGAFLEGEVRNDAGEPLPGVLVWWTTLDNRASWPRTERAFDDRSGGGRATTGPDGSFRLAGVPSEEVEVSAVADLHAIARELIDGSAPPFVRLVLAPLAELTVELVDAGDGSPLAAFAVTSHSSGGESYADRGLNVVARDEEAPPARPGRFFARWKRSGDPSVRGGEVTARISALGYRTVVRTVSFAFGVRRTETVALERTSPEAFGRLRLRAEFEGGAPFSGRLHVVVRAADHDPRGGPPPTVAFFFVDGDATEPLVLPSGTYWLHPRGGGPEGAFWTHPSEAATRADVVRDSVAHATFRLRGSTLALRVLDAEGRLSRAYDLTVSPSSGAGPASGFRVAAWDVVGKSAAEFVRSTPEARVWVPPGRGTVRADVAGVRPGEAAYDAAGDGRTIALTVRLGPRIE